MPRERIRFRPGQIVPTSGQYSVYVASRYKGQVTCVRGERFPPQKQRSAFYKLTDVTRHKKEK